MTRLKDVLSAGALPPQRARLLARQIAEELSTAHEHGFSHGELNLSNVLVLGSSSGERAVLTGFAGNGNFRSGVRLPGQRLQMDIYAYGLLLEALLPGHRLAAECMAFNLDDRPGSFDLVLEELQELSTPRTWIGTFLIGAATASLFLYELSRLHNNL